LSIYLSDCPRCRTWMAVILGVLSVNLTLPGQVRVARDTFIEIASRLLRQEPV